jgi:hypothetical protein
MKKSLVAILLPLSIGMLLLNACTKDSSPEMDPTIGLVKISEGYVLGAATKAEIYSKQNAIYTGYNKFYVALYDSASGARLEDAHIKLSPLMDMGTMKHASPFENPSSNLAVKKLFPCSVIFIMSSMGGSWTVSMTIHNHKNNKEGSVTMPVKVIDPIKSRLHSFTSAKDGGKYFVTLIDPSSPIVGINDMEIAIYKKISMMSFPADSSLTVSNTPEMPTMGHGSPNNINPTHIGNGHYKGKVNFTMTGLWKLNMDYLSGTAVADTTQFFEVQF